MDNGVEKLKQVGTYVKLGAKIIDPRTGFQHLSNPYKRWAHYILMGASAVALSTLLYLPFSTAIIAVLCTWVAYCIYLMVILNTKDRAEVALGGVNDIMAIFGHAEQSLGPITIEDLQEVQDGLSK